MYDCTPQINIIDFTTMRKFFLYLLNKSIKENYADSRKPTVQAVIISFVVIIVNTIGFKFELKRKRRKRSHVRIKINARQKS